MKKMDVLLRMMVSRSQYPRQKHSPPLTVRTMPGFDVCSIRRLIYFALRK